MSIKTYLRSLLEAFLGSKKAWVSSQAAPIYASVVFSTMLSSGYRGVAPSDGIVAIRLQHSSGTPFVDIEVNGVRYTEIQWTYGSASCFLPVRKGDIYYINCASTVTFDAQNVRFVPTVGSA